VYSIRIARKITMIVSVTIAMILTQSAAHAAAMGPLTPFTPNAAGQWELFTPNPVPLSSTCIPSATLACVQNNRWGIQILVNGAPAFVATSNNESAVFWFYSPDDWEVVAKVINGCPNDNYWWFFGAGATGTPFSFNFIDYARNRGAAYSSSYCPLEDTGQIAHFSCP
jgi:hypothetical protein